MNRNYSICLVGTRRCSKWVSLCFRFSLILFLRPSFKLSLYKICRVTRACLGLKFCYLLKLLFLLNFAKFAEVILFSSPLKLFPRNFTFTNKATSQLYFSNVRNFIWTLLFVISLLCEFFLVFIYLIDSLVFNVCWVLSSFG